MLIRAIAEMEDGVDKAPVIPAKAGIQCLLSNATGSPPSRGRELHYFLAADAEMVNGVDKATLIPAKAGIQCLLSNATGSSPSRGPRVAVFAHAA